MAQPISAERAEEIAAKLRSARDAMLTITNAGPDMPTQALRSVASLTGRLLDEILVEIS